jgi:pyoverdine/dityrosine biosynthesis protein Dit1
LRTAVRLSIRCGSISLGGKLGSVLVPDNEGFPSGLHFAMKVKEEEVKFEIESESFVTAVSTSLALLRDVSLFEQVWLLSERADG